MLVLLICTCATASVAKSPVGDWQAVQQDIPTGWQMIVVTSMTFPCVYESANDRELVCKRLDRANASDAEIHIRVSAYAKYGWRNAKAPTCWRAVRQALDWAPSWVRF